MTWDLNHDEDEESDETCYCDFEHNPNEWCPQCCPYAGVFAGGTETCEFCDYGESCQESLHEISKEALTR